MQKILLENKPIHGIWSTMGKREKKKSPSGPKGSRMIAYLPIPMRLLELKYLGSVINFTKPQHNPMGVGGVGLHDLGERLSRLWVERGMIDDIAGWDTRVSATMLEMELDFIGKCYEGSSEDRKIIENLYKIYKYPHILVPMESDYTRRELLEGFGQHMSGSVVTYGMNTWQSSSLLHTVVPSDTHV